MFCVSHAFTSVHCFLVVTCLERVDLLALVGDVYCIFVTFLCGVLGQVWYLIVSFPDLCHLYYFDNSGLGNMKASIRMFIFVFELVCSYCKSFKLFNDSIYLPATGKGSVETAHLCMHFYFLTLSQFVHLNTFVVNSQVVIKWCKWHFI